MKYKIKHYNEPVSHDLMKNMSFGRLWPKPYYYKSIGNFIKIIRQTVCANRLVDVDMVNAHPNILLQICQEKDIECECLEEYVNNREKILKDIMKTYNVSREDAKLLVIMIMYGGDVKTWCAKLDSKTYNKNK